ncbi:MAG TPA: tetratricopeptide repeat protein [Pyrinomonadaceae bacterium]|jgi:Predicted N-acetylglucosaminyl transferase|nr:tetratricopeptide repeat protein [Pyrinomonadaceae bacterium]
MKILVSLVLSLFITLPTLFASSPTASAAQARDNWRSVRTNNLFVIGNADAESLRQVAVWLEFFHSAFARLASRSTINSSVPTTVIVFRDEASFLPFKPLYQGKPANVSGYFQPGEEVNYIAISLESGQRDHFSTVFHEYVHLHLRDNVPGAPLWLNEGLAEFYSSIQFAGSEAELGVAIPAYVQLLGSQEMLPLKTLFSIGTNSPHYNERDKSGIFYGESWALVHYLIQGDGGRHQEQFKRFLQSVSRGDATDQTFEDAFGMSLVTAEQKLREYVRRGEFQAQRLTLGDSAKDYTAYTAVQRTSLSEGEANYYLGDLLLHINRGNDAERYFLQAISLEPGFIPPYASMGLLRVSQRRYEEAKKYLQKAATSTQTYLIHYLYAYVLSRETAGPTGRVTGYSHDSVVTMRDQLLRSIKLSPQFAPAYHLLALVELVADEQLDEAVVMAEKAHQIEPSRASYSMLLAHVYLRRSNTNAARQILESLTRDTDAKVRMEAQTLLDSLTQSGNQRMAGDSSGSGNRIIPSETVLADPVQPGSSRTIVGGTTTSGTIRDGQTIESSGSMPNVDELLVRYVEALGGADAIKAVTSRMIKGSLDVVGVSRNGSFEIYGLAPNKTLTVMQAYGMGTIKVGFNGLSGWIQTASGFRPLKGMELGAFQRDSDFYEPIRLKNNFARINLLGTSKIGYREVYVLELQPTSGGNERLYLDAETYLPVRLNAVRTNGLHTATVEVYLDDWQSVDGIKFPFNITQIFPGMTLVFRTTEIRHGVAVDAKLFEASAK